MRSRTFSLGRHRATPLRVHTMGRLSSASQKLFMSIALAATGQPPQVPPPARRGSGAGVAGAAAAAAEEDTYGDDFED